jgi:hypothetical protein
MGHLKDASREVGGFSNERFIEIVGSFYNYCYGRV